MKTRLPCKWSIMGRTNLDRASIKCPTRLQIRWFLFSSLKLTASTVMKAAETTQLAYFEAAWVSQQILTVMVDSQHPHLEYSMFQLFLFSGCGQRMLSVIFLYLLFVIFVSSLVSEHVRLLILAAQNIQADICCFFSSKFSTKHRNTWFIPLQKHTFNAWRWWTRHHEWFFCKTKSGVRVRGPRACSTTTSRISKHQQFLCC